MVYCCRPSKNCLGCRQRRIKCDLGLPACSQCKRVGMECSGYRDQVSLLFRDENAKTQQRSATAKDRPRRQKKDRLILTTWPSSSVDDRGLRFFLDRFTSCSHWIKSNGQMSTVHPYIRELMDSQPTRESLVAVGLAALANATDDKTCHTAALQKYTASINYIRRTLQDPVNASLDSTLKILVTLCIYEFVNNRPGSLYYWKVHVEGALAFIRQKRKPSMPERPKDMPELQSYLFVIMKYFSSGGEIPGELLAWTPAKGATPLLDSASSLIDILIRFVRLSDYWRHARTDVEEIVHAALLLDKELEDWEANLDGDEWSVVTKESKHLSGLYQGKYHMYSNTWAHRILNHYRWSRILVNDILYLHILKLATPTDVQIMQQQTALATMSRLAADICFSVPSQTNLLRQEVGEEADTTPVNGVFILVLPLMIAGSACGVPDELHEWVVMMLGVIGSYIGIRFASESIPGLKKMREAKKACGFASWVCPLDFSGVMRVTSLDSDSDEPSPDGLYPS